jgi:hypothetical protein
VLVDDVPVELLDDEVDVLDVLVLVDSLDDVLNSPMYHETLLTVDEYPINSFVCWFVFWLSFPAASMVRTTNLYAPDAIGGVHSSYSSTELSWITSPMM